MQPIATTPTLPARPASSRAPAAAPEPAPPPAAGPNPSLRIDPALNMLVAEFRGPDGRVTRTAPTEQELRDYRAAQLRGEAPAGKAPPPAEAPCPPPVIPAG